MIKKKFILILLLQTLIISCTTNYELYNTGQIPLGIPKKTLCNIMVDTYISNDPCYGKSYYVESSSTLIIYPNDQSMFFVFTNANSSGSNGSLALITRSWDEAMFFANNVN